MGTATSVLECSKRYEWLPEINCTSGSVAHGDFGSNPAITGIGTDISFVLTAGLSLLSCGFVQLFCDRLRFHKLRWFLEPLVVSFSDQQIIRGLSMSIATLYTSSACTVDAYRYNILCYLILMTIVSHLSSILVLRSYVNGQKTLSIVRFVLVFTQIFFAGIIFSSRVTDDFPTGVNTNLVLPAVCFQLPNAKPYSGLEEIPGPHHRDVAAFSSYIVLAVFYAINIAFSIAHILTHYFRPGSTWEMRSQEDRAKTGTWFWWLGLMRGLILLGAWGIWVWSVYELYHLREWMNASGWMSAQRLQEDNQWTFGQLLSVFILGAAPLSVLNAWNGFQEKDVQQRMSVKSKSSRIFEDPPEYRSDTEMQNLIR
ncbi:hypothetical protein VTL71DRAFT_4991 [Oculimacula yallundae]|uniref:Uncharacterized protein n=1 Tax=Oculimacula yallundae TaxID=86028 RepID=A0ABR4C459_9HELO